MATGKHATLTYHSPRSELRKTNYVDLSFAENLAAFRAQRASLVERLESSPMEEWTRGSLIRDRPETVASYVDYLTEHETVALRADRGLAAVGAVDGSEAREPAHDRNGGLERVGDQVREAGREHVVISQPAAECEVLLLEQPRGRGGTADGAGSGPGSARSVGSTPPPAHRGSRGRRAAVVVHSRRSPPPATEGSTAVPRSRLDDSSWAGPTGWCCR